MARADNVHAAVVAALGFDIAESMATLLRDKVLGGGLGSYMGAPSAEETSTAETPLLVGHYGGAERAHICSKPPSSILHMAVDLLNGGVQSRNGWVSRLVTALWSPGTVV